MIYESEKFEGTLNEDTIEGITKGPDKKSMVLKKMNIHDIKNAFEKEVISEDVYSYPLGIANDFLYFSNKEGFNVERMKTDNTKRESFK